MVPQFWKHWYRDWKKGCVENIIACTCFWYVQGVPHTSPLGFMDHCSMTSTLTVTEGHILCRWNVSACANYEVFSDFLEGVYTFTRVWHLYLNVWCRDWHRYVQYCQCCQKRKQTHRHVKLHTHLFAERCCLLKGVCWKVLLMEKKKLFFEWESLQTPPFFTWGNPDERVPTRQHCQKDSSVVHLCFGRGNPQHDHWWNKKKFWIFFPERDSLM